MEVHAYNDLNISNLSTNTNSASPKTNTSLFNQLIAQNDVKETESSSQEVSLNEKVKDAINKLKEDNPITSQNSNTHDELILMLKLKDPKAS